MSSGHNRGWAKGYGQAPPRDHRLLGAVLVVPVALAVALLVEAFHVWQ